MENPLSTPASLRESAEFMDQMRRGSAEWLTGQIKTKQLIPEGELRTILGVNQECITDALNANRMYFISMPSGERYFPAFVCDEKYDLQTLELVCQKLGSIPGSSKHFFYTSKSTYLQGKFLLAALETGNIEQVLTAAEGFSER